MAKNNFDVEWHIEYERIRSQRGDVVARNHNPEKQIERGVVKNTVGFENIDGPVRIRSRVGKAVADPDSEIELGGVPSTLGYRLWNTEERMITESSSNIVFAKPFSSDEEIKEHFSKFPGLKEWTIIRSADNKPKGRALVTLQRFLS